MTITQSPDNPDEMIIRVKIRLDFKGTGKQSKFFFGGKSIEKLAEETRDHNVSMFRNIPIQGIKIIDIDMGTDVYTVYDDINNTESAFAPVILDVSADSVEDLLKLIARDDFRKIEVTSPATINLNKFDVERLIFKVSEEFKGYRQYLERKYNLR